MDIKTNSFNKPVDHISYDKYPCQVKVGKGSLHYNDVSSLSCAGGAWQKWHRNFNFFDENIVKWGVPNYSGKLGVLEYPG